MKKGPLACVYRLVGMLFVLALFLSSARTTFASTASSPYFDWGPYYSSQEKVLGFTLSSQEELPSLTVPENATLPAASTLPGSIFYIPEIFSENLRLTFTFDPIKKEELRLDYASERIAEAKSLIDKNRPDLAAKAVASYQDQMSALANNLERLSKTNNPKLNEAIEKVAEGAAANSIVAQNLALSSPPSQASFWNKVSESSQETMDMANDVAGKPAIPEDLSASIQKLKDQGLITPEESVKLYGLDSRREVREELNQLTSNGQFPSSEIVKLDEAVKTYYPDTFKDGVNIQQFAELRSYESQPQPTRAIIQKIESWQNQKGDVPPPAEIRPFLYYSRAQEISGEIDLSGFKPEQQAEMVRFYPDFVSQNPSYVPPSAPSPSPTPQPGEQPPESSPSPEGTGPYLQTYTGPKPGGLGYYIKMAQEQFTTALTFNPTKKIERKMEMADETLRVASILAGDTEKSDLYKNTLANYQNLLNQVSEGIKDFKGKEEDQKDLAKDLELTSGRHNILFEKGLLPPPPTDEKEVYKKAIEATQDAMDKSADALDRPALPISLTNRLQDLKAQGLVLEEEVNDLTQSASREEVRDKVRALTQLGAFPPADSKKLDEAQALSFPGDYNQLVEVRKIEELQNLRAVQSEFAQTASLRERGAGLTQRANILLSDIDPSLIDKESLAGKEDLLKVYETIVATLPARPINSGQFQEALGASPKPISADAVITTCPIGTTFKQAEGCIWEDTGKKINDYDQYRCLLPGEFWSFAARKCLPYDQTGTRTDSSPLCPVGYEWSWEFQNCQTSAGGSILPSPKPDDGKEKACPNEAVYETSKGCVWENSKKPIYDQSQYRCEQGFYYSFDKQECVATPKDGGFQEDAWPKCPKESIWVWEEGACKALPKEESAYASDLEATKVAFVAPDNPLYFIKSSFEKIQLATTITPLARERVKLSQAQERFAEAYYFLEKGDEKRFGEVLGTYTNTMQDIYNDLSKTKGLNESARQNLAEKLSQGAVDQNLLLQKATAIGSSDLATPINTALSVTIQGIDRAADLRDEPAISQEIKDKLNSLPEGTIADDKKKELLDLDNRVEARIRLGELASGGIISQADTAFLNEDLTRVDPKATVELITIQKLGEIANLNSTTQEIEEKVKKNEEIANKLDEFQRNFTPGEKIDEDIRPYVRLNRIEEVSRTIRPDIVKIEDFQNRKDLQLAVATLQQEYKPTRESIRQIEEFRRNNPGQQLPPNLARAEALSFSLGVRERASECFLPSPPFPANTPCPPSGASIPIYSYSPDSNYFPGIVDFRQTSYSPSPGSGEPQTYGKGPQSTAPGSCPNGYHWMYDSGGWCMSNTGNYSNQPSPTTGYGPSTYYGVAPTYYTTTPPAGTVPGSGPSPVSPGKCPAGFHWMQPTSDQSGWCMADGGTYTPGYSYPGSNYPGSIVPETQCPSGSYWSSYTRSCIFPGPATPGGNYNYPSYPSGGGCSPPPGGCGSGWFDSGTCSCRAASSQGCYNVSASSCGSGWYWDSSACTCRQSGSSTYTPPSGTYTPPRNTCVQPSTPCPGGSWFDFGTCTCRQSSGSTPSGSSGSSPSGSCPSGYHWMSENGGWCMADNASSGNSPPPQSPPPSTESPPPPPPAEPPPPVEPPPPTTP